MTFKDIIETCCHYVSFNYDVGKIKLTDELKSRLTEEAEDRAKTCIIEGYIQGELNCLWVSSGGKEQEIRGWWKISTIGTA